MPRRERPSSGTAVARTRVPGIARSSGRRRAKARPQALALVRGGALPERHVSASERRLEELVLRLSTLDAEYDALSVALSDFEEESAERLGPAQEELSRAQRVVRRLEQVRAELDADLQASREDAQPSPRKAPRNGAPKARAPATSDARDDDLPLPDVNVPLPRDLKELYRRLARRMHPDLATSEADRARRSQVLARLNAAFAEDDRVRLELLAAEIECGGEAESTEDMRQVYAERRIASLALSVEQLEGDLRRLRETSAFRRAEERRLREERGEDPYAGEIRSTQDRARTIRSTFRATAKRVESSVMTLNAAFVKRTDVSPAQLSFRPAVVETGHATAVGRRFAEKLGETARQSKWKAAWIVAAFFSEMADRPPTGLRSLEAWAERWDRLRPSNDRSAPAFEEALAELPTELELGCRLQASGVRFGVQLRDPLHVAGVAAALDIPTVRTVARDVLCAIGREATCGKCRAAVHAVHLHRVRDLDPLHALVCPRCGTFLENYRAYGRPEGEEALAPFALALGVVEEQCVSFGGVPLRLEMLPSERRRLTARRLTERFRSALLEGLTPDLVERRLTVRARGAILAPSAAVPRGAPITLSFAATKRETPSASRVVTLLRARRGGRFRRG
jgi:hypothetical protein